MRENCRCSLDTTWRWCSLLLDRSYNRLPTPVPSVTYFCEDSLSIFALRDSGVAISLVNVDIWTSRQCSAYRKHREKREGWPNKHLSKKEENWGSIAGSWRSVILNEAEVRFISYPAIRWLVARHYYHVCASNAYIAIGFTTVTPRYLINLKLRSIVVTVYLDIVEMVNIS